MTSQALHVALKVMGKND